LDCEPSGSLNKVEPWYYLVTLPGITGYPPVPAKQPVMIPLLEGKKIVVFKNLYESTNLPSIQL
jgi:hypothetical protein